MGERLVENVWKTSGTWVKEVGEMLVKRVNLVEYKDVIFPGLFEFSGIGKSREIVTISREFSGTGFMQNNPK